MIEPVPHEKDRYWVASASRPGMKHLVDVDYEGKIACSCEANFCNGITCRHIRIVKEYLKLKTNERKPFDEKVAT